MAGQSRRELTSPLSVAATHPAPARAPQGTEGCSLGGADCGVRGIVVGGRGGSRDVDHSSWGGWDGPDYGVGNFLTAAAYGFDWNAAVSYAQSPSGYLHADSGGSCGYANPPSPCTDFGISIWTK